MQTLCLASLGSGGLFGCGDGIYAPRPALALDADAGGDKFQMEVRPNEPASDVLPADFDEDDVKNVKLTLRAGAATLAFPDNSFSTSNPAKVTLHAMDLEVAETRHGAIGPVYKISVSKVPPSSHRPIFTVNPQNKVNIQPPSRTGPSCLRA